MFSLRNKKNIMWIPPLICSYDLLYILMKNGNFHGLVATLSKSFFLSSENVSWGANYFLFRENPFSEGLGIQDSKQGPVVQSIVSLTSSLVDKMLTVLLSTVSNSQVFLLKKCE